MLCVASRVDHSIKPVKVLLAVLKSEPRRQQRDAGLATDWISFVLTWHKIRDFFCFSWLGPSWATMDD
jgi:hypothetical protein